MKKILVRLLSAFLTAALLIPAAPEAAAYEPGDPYSPDLSELIRDADHRTYVDRLLYAHHHQCVEGFAEGTVRHVPV